MTNHAKVGGILTIIAGSFSVFQVAGILLAIFMFQFMFGAPFLPPEAAPADEFLPMFTNIMTVFYGVWGLFLVLAGTLAIVGGVYALKKKYWGLALAGAIAGTFTFFPCGIPAIIFVSLARPEFSAPEPAAPTGPAVAG